MTEHLVWSAKRDLGLACCVGLLMAAGAQKPKLGRYFQRACRGVDGSAPTLGFWRAEPSVDELCGDGAS